MKVTVDGWVKGHSNSLCNVRIRGNLILEDLLALLPLVFLLERSYESFLVCIRWQPNYRYNQDGVNFLMSAASSAFSRFSYYAPWFLYSWDNNMIWKGWKFKLNMLKAIPGNLFIILYLFQSMFWHMVSLENSLSWSSRTCSCFAFRDILNPWVWKGNFDETTYHITLFSFDFSCLEKTWLYFLQILVPSLIILQAHWISEWREKKPQWLDQSLLTTCVRLGPEDEVQCCGVLRGRMLHKTAASLTVWVVSLWIFFVHSHLQVL